MNFLKWLTRNLGTLLISVLLAVIVWISATVTDDPNQQGVFSGIPLEIIGKSSDLVLTNDVPDEVAATLNAPRSIWDQLNKNRGLIRAWIDLEDLAAGDHTLPVNIDIDLSPVRIISSEPDEIIVVLEPFIEKQFEVQLTARGEPPLGYRKGEVEVSPEEVTISGPASAVNRVSQVIALLDVDGASQTVQTTVPVRAVDGNGADVGGVQISPKGVNATVPISILGGYKNVAVKLLATGQVASGYRLTSITVNPPTVTVFSSDPKLVNELPGFVETKPVDLNGLTDDSEFNVELDLPEGISLVSEPGVLVQIDIAPIEGNLKLTIPVEVLGLSPEFAAQISPPVIDIIVFGPLPVLDGLTSASFRAVVDLTNLTTGTYLLTPELDLVPTEVQVEGMVPESVAVTIIIAPTPTATPLVTSTPRPPATVSPTPTRQP